MSIMIKLKLLNWTARITALLVQWIWMGLSLMIKYLLKCWHCFSLLNLALVLIIFLCKNCLEWNTLENSLDLFCEASFFWGCSLSLISTIQFCMEFRCHVWAAASNCYLCMWGELQKRMCRSAGSTLLLFVNPWLIVKMWTHQVFSIWIA